MREFVHLHNHTEYSLLDGASRVPDLAAKVASQNSPAVAMTDHGNLFGAVDFFETVQQHDIKPIIGCEVYVAPTSRHERKAVDGETNFHFVLLAENETGYRNLNKLVSAGYFEGFYYKPRIDWELLQEHHEGLIALSGCLQGEVANAVLKGDNDLAKKKVRMFRDLFGPDNFFLEIQANGLAEQAQVNDAKIAMAKEFGLGLVATNDNHYIEKDDAFPHDCLLCIGTRKMVEDPERMRFPNDQFYVKHPDEMWEVFKDTPAALENTMRIAERCSFEFEFGKFHLPKYAAEDDANLDQMLHEAARQGLTSRLNEAEQAGMELTDETVDAYKERLGYELGIIEDMGFAGYFLIVSDFIRWAKGEEIPVGPGRGSAAGSLVSYATRITDIDPLRFGLLFERFLNPERKSMPDIDVDICMNRRGEVIDYVSERYGGADHVAQIGAFGTAKGRQIFKDVGRVLGLSFAETDKITKLMPAPPADFKLGEILDDDPELQRALKEDPILEDTYKIASQLEGITRHATVHAAGVVVSDKPLVEYLPLYKGEHGESVTQYDMNAVEKIGLVKFDFLGLKTLTAMQATVDLVRRYQGDDIDLDAIPENDPKTFELLQEGRTHGVFQLESEGMRSLLRQLKPESLAEVIAVTALYRPGPMQAGMTRQYVDRKHGKEKISYEWPELEPILSETYGVIVYQEQVMEIARVLAGYSLGEADILRKAMGKKIAEVMEQQRARFVDGCVDNGHDRKAAGELFDLIVEFAGYGFNKSHSAAYGLIAYQTAYLKAHYPVAFMAALMQCDRDKSQKLIPLLREARSMGIDILPPSIEHSGVTFTPDGDSIRFGLAAIKGVGEAPVQEILRVREEAGIAETLSGFLTSLEAGTLNKKLLEGFAKSGALDCFGIPRKTLLENLERIAEWTARKARDKAAGQTSLFGGADEETGGFDDLHLDDVGEWEAAELAEGERETIGFYLSAHPLDPYVDGVARFANTTLAEEELCRFGDKSVLRFGGVITTHKIQNSPKGRRAYLTVEDHAGSTEVGVFGDNYHNFAPLLEEGRPVFIETDLMVDAEGMRRMFAKRIVPLAELETNLGKELHLCIALADLADDRAARLSRIVRTHPGKLRVKIHLKDASGNEAIVRLPDAFRVAAGPELDRHLGHLFEGAYTSYVEA